MSEVTALDKINESIPAFSDWSKRYVMSFPDPDVSLMDYKTASDDTNSSEQPSVCVSALKDIEENVWSPRFGLKGKLY
jgi:DNA replication ATP-dependent helicase Dna2